MNEPRNGPDAVHTDDNNNDDDIRLFSAFYFIQNCVFDVVAEYHLSNDLEGEFICSINSGASEEIDSFDERVYCSEELTTLRYFVWRTKTATDVSEMMREKTYTGNDDNGDIVNSQIAHVNLNMR